MELCDLVNSNIGLCADKTFKGFNRVGWWALYDNINQAGLSVADGVVSFVPTAQFYEIYDGSLKPFDGTKVMTETSSKHGYQLTNQTVMFPLRANTVENNLLVTALGKDSRIVVILDQKGIDTAANGKYPVFGLSGGLRLKTPVQDWTADVSWDLEFEDKNTSEALLFVDAATQNLVANYEIITGLTIPNNGVIYLAVDSDKTCYVYKEGTNILLTSTDGVISQINGDGEMGVILITQKNSTVLTVSNSDFIGSITTNAIVVACESCLLLTEVIANNAESVSLTGSQSITNTSAILSLETLASGCALTGDSISSNLVAWYESGLENGFADFSGGTNAQNGQWTQAGLDAYAILEYNRGWTIPHNEA